MGAVLEWVNRRAMNQTITRIVDDAACHPDDTPCATVLQERRLMAAEVHDSIAQTLTFVKMRLPLLEDALAAHDDRLAQRYLADVRQAVGEAHTSLREIITHLRAPVDPRGLGQALQVLAARFRERSGVALALANELPNLHLGHDAEAEVYHVVQEALANIERHARASQAWLRIAALPEGGVQICIDDNGVGPSPAADESTGHHGRAIMNERARRLGGTLDVAPRPGGGTRVRLVLHDGAAGAGHA